MQERIGGIRRAKRPYSNGMLSKKAIILIKPHQEQNPPNIIITKATIPANQPRPILIHHKHRPRPIPPLPLINPAKTVNPTNHNQQTQPLTSPTHGSGIKVIITTCILRIIAEAVVSRTVN